MEKMDLNASGCTQITTGTYRNVRVSGSSRLSGTIQCENIHISGSAGGDSDIQASGDAHFSGSTHIQKLTAKNVIVSGSFSCGSCVTEDTFHASGSFSCDGDLKCRQMQCSGSGKIRGGLEAETVRISGDIRCEGLMNAEDIDIRIVYNTDIDSIGGGTISIHREPAHTVPRGCLAFLLGLSRRTDPDGLGRATVKNAIEGDSISIEYTTAKSVVGRNVTIGDECVIDLVQYSEHIEISPEAKIGRCEKI